MLVLISATPAWLHITLAGDAVYGLRVDTCARSCFRMCEHWRKTGVLCVTWREHARLYDPFLMHGCGLPQGWEGSCFQAESGGQYLRQRRGRGGVVAAGLDEHAAVIAFTQLVRWPTYRCPRADSAPALVFLMEVLTAIRAGDAVEQ